jgi:uncharacterized protein (TIGR02271 family)
MTQGESFTTPDALKGLTAYDRNGDKIGSVEQVYLDDSTGRPEWVTVKTGLFGTKESFVPLSGARQRSGDLHVACLKDVVKDAPRLDADQHLDPSQERELYRHYGISTNGAGTAGVGQGRRADGHDFAMSSGTGDKDEMVRSEERLHVGVQEEEAGRARLRKVVVTENVTTTVPVSHEEVRVVREPIVDGDRPRAGADIGEAEAEVTLHREKPVVRKEAVPVERVRLETEAVTEQEEVTDSVRKERIEYDGLEGERGTRRDRKQGPGGR